MTTFSNFFPVVDSHFLYFHVTYIASYKGYLLFVRDICGLIHKDGEDLSFYDLIIYFPPHEGIQRHYYVNLAHV